MLQFFLLYLARQVQDCMIQPPMNLFLFLYIGGSLVFDFMFRISLMLKLCFRRKHVVMREKYKKQLQTRNKAGIYCSRIATILSSQLNDQELFTFDSDGTTAIT